MKSDELSRRAVACKHWRWMPGMLVVDSSGEEQPARVIGDGSSVVYPDTDGTIDEGDILLGDVPDLSDPATLGCLLALVREALDDSRIHCRARANKFRVYSGVTPTGEWADSEAEALVATLEAST